MRPFFLEYAVLFIFTVVVPLNTKNDSSFSSSLHSISHAGLLCLCTWKYESIGANTLIGTYIHIYICTGLTL